MSLVTPDSVKIGNFNLTYPVKIGYIIVMLGSMVSFVLRLGLIAAFWVFVWRYVEPRTQAMRILRAVLLVFGLLGVMAALKLSG